MLTLAQMKTFGLWSLAGAQVTCQFLQWGTFFALARLLSPHDFGTVAAALIFLDLALIVCDLGIGATIIQRQDLTPAHLHTAFWLNLGLGILLSFSLLVLAGPLSDLFHDPSLAPLLTTLPLAFLLASTGVVPQSLIERAMKFRQIAFITLTAQATYSVVTLATAWMGLGAWSVVLGMIGWHAARLAVMAAFTTWRPRWGVSRKALREIAPYSFAVLSAGLVGYGKKSLDTTLIGALLGPVALGIYALCNRLVTWPLLRISAVVTQVAFPALSRLQNDDHRFHERYLQLQRWLAIVTLPLLAGLAALAPDVIPLLFGDRWHEAIVPTQVLCVIGMLKAVSTTDGVLLFSKGRAGLDALLNVTSGLTLGLTIALAVPWGLIGVVTALALVELATFPIYRLVINRQVGLSSCRYWSAMRLGGVAAAFLFLALLFFRHLSDGWAWPADLVGAGLLCLIFYTTLLKRGGIPLPRLRAQEEKLTHTKG